MRTPCLPASTKSREFPRFFTSPMAKCAARSLAPPAKRRSSPNWIPLAFLPEPAAMTNPPFRSPCERVGGLVHFGRMLDKIRLHLRGELPEEYRQDFGLSVGLDGTLCGVLGIEHADLIERVSAGGTDEEILEWCYTRGTRLNAVQKRVWNEYARKLG